MSETPTHQHEHEDFTAACCKKFLHENTVIDFVSDCWWWQPGPDPGAAIYMFAHYRGRTPSALVALCGNDACVNPNHHGEVAA